MFDNYGCLSLMALCAGVAGMVMGIGYMTDPTTDPFREGKAATTAVRVEANEAAKVGETVQGMGRSEKPTVCCLGCGQKGAVVAIILGGNDKGQKEDFAGLEKTGEIWLLREVLHEDAISPKKPGTANPDSAAPDVGDFDETLGGIGLNQGEKTDVKFRPTVEKLLDEEKKADAETAEGTGRDNVDGEEAVEKVFHTAHDTRTAESEETP